MIIPPAAARCQLIRFIDTGRRRRLYFGRMMTERERVLTLLAGGRPDRIPWFGDLDYWATSLIGRGRTP